MLCTIETSAADYQWSAPADGIVSGENGKSPEGFLWIPADCKEVKALIFAFQNMNEETLFSSDRFRGRMARNGIAILWIAPGFGQEWNIYDGVQSAFEGLMIDLSKKSGHPELTKVPLIPFGHSAQATMPWNFAAWNPERTLCIISYHGDAPRTNLCGFGRSNIEWGRTRNIDGIPGLMVMGEYEWWDARLRPALAFRMMYPGSCISFLGDAGRGHFDLSDRTIDYISRFIEKSVDKRLANDQLVPVKPEEGWLAQSWHPGQNRRVKAAAWNDYRGCRHEAFWYFDKEMADMTEARYEETRGKKPCWLCFVGTGGSLLGYDPKAHCKQSIKIKPDKDDTFCLTAVFTDSLRRHVDKRHLSRPVRIRYVSGAAVALDDTTFRIDRNHPTWKNPRRMGKVTLCAESPSTDEYKEAVQEIEVTISD